ncbi:MAG: RNA polymerase sigma factor, partial [Anaerolineaceae bacterium]
DDQFLINFRHDKLLDSTMLNKKVRDCLSRVDVKYREVLMLNFFENLKYDEISDILRIPTSTVGVRIRRGKIALKKLCQEEGVEYE